MEIFYILVYLLAYVVSVILTLMKEQGHCEVEFPSIMYEGLFEHKPSVGTALSTNLLPFVGFLACWSVYRKGGFSWPKKGVNFMKPKGH